MSAARQMDLIFAGVGMGAGLTPPLVTAIILRYGWRAAFWFSAAIDAVASLVWYLAARDTPAEHPLAGEAEKISSGDNGISPIPSPLPVDATRVTKPSVPWAKIFRSKEVFALTSSYFAFGYVAWIFFAWFYIYMAQVRGFNLKTSAAFSMLPFIAMTLAASVEALSAIGSRPASACAPGAACCPHFPLHARRFSW